MTMSFYERVSEFASLPIAQFPTSKSLDPRPDMLAAPGAYAWRLEHNVYRDDSDPLAELFPLFLDKVDTAAVTALVIGNWGEAASEDPTGVLELLVESADRFPALRSVFLGEILAEECEISWIQQADVSPLLQAFPHLGELWIRGSQELGIGVLEHASLHTLVVQSGGLSGEFVRALDACTLPKLAHLELYLGTDDYGGDATASDLTEILAGTNFPKLTYLGLRDALAANEMAEALADAPVVAQLAVLDLSLGALTDRGAESLLAGQPLTHLEKLDLHYHYLSEAMMERIEEEFLGTGTEVDLGDQQEPDDLDDDGEPTWLSVAFSE